MMGKPWRDPALPPLKPPGPQHQFPLAWYGSPDVACQRCGRRISEVERTNVECVTDEHMAQAVLAGQAVQRLRR